MELRTAAPPADQGKDHACCVYADPLSQTPQAVAAAVRGPYNPSLD